MGNSLSDRFFTYVFDGLANVATHFGKEIFSSHEEYYRIELPIEDLYQLSLADTIRYIRLHNNLK
jgi:hypothetical protein